MKIFQIIGGLLLIGLGINNLVGTKLDFSGESIGFALGTLVITAIGVWLIYKGLKK